MALASSLYPKTILLKGRGERKEAVAAGAIKPGQLLTITTAGLLAVHASAGDKAAPLFAVENDLVGKTIDDDYAQNDYVQAEYLRTGMEVLAWLASGENVATGTLLESAGTGNFVTAANGVAILQSLEAVDASGEAKRIACVIL